MPLTLLGGAAGFLGGAIVSHVRNKRAVKQAEQAFDASRRKLAEEEDLTKKALYKLGLLKYQVWEGFDRFSQAFEKIKNRPQFTKVRREQISLPKLELAELEKLSFSAKECLALGALAGGFGMLAFAAVYGIMEHKKVQRVKVQVEQSIERMDQARDYLSKLRELILAVTKELDILNRFYIQQVTILEEIVQEKQGYHFFSEEDKVILDNTIMLVKLLHHVCGLQLLAKGRDGKDSIQSWPVQRELAQVKEARISLAG